MWDLWWLATPPAHHHSQATRCEVIEVTVTLPATAARFWVYLEPNDEYAKHGFRLVRKILKQLLNDSHHLYMNSPKHKTLKNSRSYAGVGMVTFKHNKATDKHFEDLGIISLTKEEIEARKLRLSQSRPKNRQV